MAGSEDIKEIVNHTAIQAMAVMIVLRDADVGPQPIIVASQKEEQIQRQDRPILVKPAFNWNSQDRSVDFMNFEMEVMNILETKAYKLRRKRFQ